ncbi:undecaprenyldiphospho-muramoylpentapeptide beta-N-acetylglucosaminyltransferase [bacterium TMED277]|nr:MAG: undecaprenyldiphospho-muramoylpentapeptide beta-N-acetylglucosaminyltransferase [bacterium TMED277]
MRGTRSCILSTGGTGGHVFPTIALAESLTEKGWRVIIFSDIRGQSFLDQIKHVYQIETVFISSESNSFIRRLLLYQYQMPISLIRTLRIMLKEKPEFVIGFGGVSTIPVLLAGLLLRFPIFLQEQNAVLGRVNRLFQRFSNVVFHHFDKTKFLDERKSLASGNPVRASILEKENCQYLTPGPWPNTILVLGGSQGASLMSTVIPNALSKLTKKTRERLTIFHQARKEDVETVVRSYNKIGVKAKVELFFENVEQIISESQLIICRAGANTLTDISTIGRPAIFIPLGTAKDDHQRINAKIFENNQAAIVVEENKTSTENLTESISKILRSPSKALAMAKNSYAMSKSNSSGKMISQIEKVIGRQIDSN